MIKLKIALPFLGSFFLAGCTTSIPRIKGAVFFHDRIPPHLCTKELNGYGIYRRLSNGKIEVLDYCSDQIRNYYAMRDDEIIVIEEPSIDPGEE